MKNIVFILLINSTLFSFSQTNSVNYFGKEIILDSRVTEHYSSEYLNELKNNSPEILVYQNFYVLHSFKIVDLSEKAKDENYLKLSQVEKIIANGYELNYSSSINEFNILNFEIHLKDQPQIIDLEHDKIFIIIDSKTDFLKKFNDYKAKQLN